MAAVVPIIAGVVLWLITDSLFALCFAALGPLMIGASLIDRRRTARRERRRAAAEADQGWARADEELRRRQREERMLLVHRHPDVAASVALPPLQGVTALDANCDLVIGHGTVASAIRTSAGDSARAREFQKRASELPNAPVAIALGRGVCVRAPAPIAAAVVRGLVMQLALRFSIGELAVVGEDLGRWGLESLPHARAVRKGAFRLVVGSESDAPHDGDAVIWSGEAQSEIPVGVSTVIDCVEPDHARVRTPQGTRELTVECVSLAQAKTLAGQCAERVEEIDALPESLALAELDVAPGEGLSVAIGRGERDAMIVDIVEDGPHAIVTGITGTGKSELLVSWVTAIAAAYGPEQVNFVLADFKGGTAFEPLRELPQVAAVITDLDDDGARRGVSSLTAELRRREAVLSAAGSRDIAAGDVRLPRLVIVVDEFAALLHDHADLGAVFIDVAARGRALGMHLILGTQRASGVIREALAANCPLRVSLRVTDPADSRLVIGTDAAADLPGGAASRGLALVRRPQDDEPRPARVALTSAADLRGIAVRWSGAERPKSPWLPPLPALLPLREVAATVADRPLTSEATTFPAHSAIVLGRADDPARQDQPLHLLRPGVDRGIAIVGGPASGKSSVLRALAAQWTDVVHVPADSEAAWDVTAEIADGSRSASLVLCDDLDLLVGGFPPEHAQLFIARWEQILRSGASRTSVITASRAAGPTARLLEGLPERAVLRMTTKLEHLAAGGDAEGFHRERPPGRARIGDREVQIVWAEDEVPVHAAQTEAWMPTRELTAIVTRPTATVLEGLSEAYSHCDVRQLGDEAAGSGRPLVFVGDAEAWQRSWALWQQARTQGEVIVRAENPSDLRHLVGVRDAPPYARPHAGRCWSVQEGTPVRRVLIPALMP